MSQRNVIKLNVRVWKIWYGSRRWAYEASFTTLLNVSPDDNRNFEKNKKES